MKVKCLISYHDTTYGEVYDVVKTPHGYSDVNGTVWIVDDVNDDYILLDDEYEVVPDDE